VEIIPQALLLLQSCKVQEDRVDLQAKGVIAAAVLLAAEILEIRVLVIAMAVLALMHSENRISGHT
jgi:hypothetical protein